MTGGPRHLAKKGLEAASAVLVFPLVLLTRALGAFLHTIEPFQMASQFLSLCPGALGNHLRRAFYRAVLRRCGAEVCIEFGTIVSQPTVQIGNRVYIGAHCSIGEAVIGDDVLLGSNVDVISGREQHHFDDVAVPIRQQGGRLQTVVIGADAWIGNGAVIAADVGTGSVVAAGSVVVKPVPDMSVVGGNPARVLRRRGDQPA
jgi:virginiamycin A acetyltransferase